MSIVVSYRRTPYGRFLGALSGVSATELGSQVLAASLAEAEIAAHEVDYVVAGQVLQAGQGQNPARQVAVSAGIPLNVPAITLNAVCLSGLEAIAHAHRLIASGEASIVACVGQESMSLAPHLLMNSRIGSKYGAIEMVDSVEIDGLTDAFEACSMGLSTEQGNTERAIAREEQDVWAAEFQPLFRFDLVWLSSLRTRALRPVIWRRTTFLRLSGVALGISARLRRHSQRLL